MHDAKMKFHFKYSKWFKNTFVVLTLLLLTTGWYLWNRSNKNDDGTSSPLKDLSTNKSSLGSRDSPCLPGRIPDSLTKLYELYNDVQTFVIFIGYPRSSHSLVGAILDAHPEIIIPHEYHIIEHWNSFQEEAIKKSGLLKYLLFFNLHSLSTWQATFGNRAEKPVFIDDGIYSYNVPGSWQGTFSDKLRVIGDKKGGGTTMELTEKPEKFAALKELNESLGISLRFLHVVRNPYDVISTWVLRLFNLRRKASDGLSKINKPATLDGFIKSFFELVETNEKIRQTYGDDTVLDILSHELISKPKETMMAVCKFLDVTCKSDYLQQAESILYGKPSITRTSVAWTEEQKQRVQDEMRKYPLFQSFRFEGEY